MGQSLAGFDDLYSCVILVALLAAITASRTVRPFVAAPSCYAAVTTIVSTPAPYRIKRIVTTGVRRYDDDGNGTISYCAPVDAARFTAARAAVEQRLHESSVPTSDNVEHVVIRSTLSSVVAEHLKYVVAKAAEAGDAFPGVEVVRLKAANGKDDDELPLPPLLPTSRARSACAEANVALERAAAPFHWAC
jgi:hypothetical protein